MTGNDLQPTVQRLLRTALFMAAVAFCAAGFPAVATAAPVWDVEEYDYCMKQTTSGVPTTDPVGQFEEADRYCCDRSGGVHNGLTCVAPPAEAEGAVLPPPRAGLPTVQVQPPIESPPSTTSVPPRAPALPVVPVLPPSAG